MYSGQSNNTGQKALASFIVIMAVVIVTVSVNALNAHQKIATSLPAPTTATTTPSANPTPMGGNMSSMMFKDGSYTADSSYPTPGGDEGIRVSLTVKSNTIVDSSVQNESNNRASAEYQSAFADSYKAYVVGKKLSDISLGSVAGSSLTSEGFNMALDQIKSQAQA